MGTKFTVGRSAAGTLIGGVGTFTGGRLTGGTRNDLRERFSGMLFPTAFPKQMMKVAVETRTRTNPVMTDCSRYRNVLSGLPVF